MYAPALPRPRARWIAILLVPLLALAGVLMPSAPASAAPGDISGATLHWGVKQSFRSYLAGHIANGQVTGQGVDTETPYGWSDIAAASELPCTVSDASLVWGFKENFRAYIDGSIANGEWTTDGDVSYATPVFTWADGSGGADHDALDVRFSGSVRFTGHGGVLDTTIANPRVVVDGGSAVLLLDVHGTTQAGEAVEQAGVEFAELDLEAATRTQDGAVLTFAEVPAVLTAAGAAAFGTYPEGEPLDPLTFTATVDGACSIALEEPSTAPLDEPDGEQAANAGWPLWATVLIIALLAVVILATVVALLVRRRHVSP